MKSRISHLFAAMLFALSLSSCGASTQGPTVWIDRPLDGAHVPLASVPILAHASDAGGVARIRFFVSDVLLTEIPVGGHRLEEASIEWMPPEPGLYTIGAQAIDGHGNVGPKAISQISVGERIELIDTLTPSPVPAVGISTDTSTTAAQSTGPSLSLTKNANCRTGPGTAYENVDTLFQGQVVLLEGKNEENNWFWVTKTSGHGHCWVSIVSVVVHGDLDEVPVISVAEITTPPPVQAPPEQVQDTTPPVISNVFIDPTTVQQAGCGSPDTFTVSATVTDASGLEGVYFWLSGPDPKNVVDGHMEPVGGDRYQITLGPIYWSTGNSSVEISANDLANNSGMVGPWTIQVVCIQ